MSNFSSVVLRKAVEGLLVILLLDTFGPNRGLRAMWELFCALPELSQIGVLSVLVLLTGLILDALKQLLLRIFKVTKSIQTWLRSARSSRSQGSLGADERTE